MGGGLNFGRVWADLQILRHRIAILQSLDLYALGSVPNLNSRTPALTFHFPEGTQPETGKGQGEADRDCNPACGRVSGSVLHRFATRGGATESRHGQKHGA